MAHPYKEQAASSHKSKTGSMGKSNNLDIPVMRAVGENSGKKLYASSSSSQQLKSQGAAPGMKRGGHVGKHRSKPKVMVVPEVAANPPSPDPSLAAAGAGASPAPAPPMPPTAPPMARGGPVTASKRGGADSGVGRLSLAKAQKKKKS